MQIFEKRKFSCILWSISAACLCLTTAEYSKNIKSNSHYRKNISRLDQVCLTYKLYSINT